MSEFRRLTDSYSVAAQLTQADVAQAAADGFRTVIANRPDGEDAGQATLAEIKAVVEAAGLTFVAIPIRGAPQPEAVAGTVAAIAAAPGPVLAYCRSGTRSTTLWAYATAKAGTMKTAEILAAAGAAGYDLAAHTVALEALQP